MRRKRILFVTHALESPYGASTSLRALLSNYDGADVDVIVPRSIRHPRNLAEAAKPYPCVRRIYEMSLPLDPWLLGITPSLHETLHVMLHRLLWQIDRRRFRALVRRNAYDVVHLNSLTLHNIVSPDLPFVTHIREIIIDPQSPVIPKLAAALGTIFIDTATERPFRTAVRSRPSTILNNPVDMSDIADYPGRLHHPSLGASTTVFAVVGRVSEIKGVDLVIDAFRLARATDAVLLIVGDGPADYVAHCRAVAQNDPRIIFWGVEPDVKRIYAATDFVIRGDPQACVGRTVYEGLYAGCGVILPGLGEPDFLFEAEHFADAIHLYKAGDPASLAQVIASCAGKKVTNRAGRSNIAEHVRQFDRFLDGCIGWPTLPEPEPAVTASTPILQSPA